MRQTWRTFIATILLTSKRPTSSQPNFEFYRKGFHAMSACRKLCNFLWNLVNDKVMQVPRPGTFGTCLTYVLLNFSSKSNMGRALSKKKSMPQQRPPWMQYLPICHLEFLNDDHYKFRKYRTLTENFSVQSFGNWKHVFQLSKLF